MKNSRRLKLFGIATIIAVVLLVAVEIGVRLSGAVDFLTYAVDNGIGYMGSQISRGVSSTNIIGFSTTEAWARIAHGSQPDILIIGNSVVMGGNPFEQKEKLGPLIQRDLGLYGLKLVDITRSPEWNETLYRDATHPNGNVALSRIPG